MILSTLALTALSHLAPLTPDAFYVAPHNSVLVDPPCDPIHPSSIWPEPAMPEWADATCWYIYLDERFDAIWDYAQCGIDCTFNNPEGSARCACYAGCVADLAARRDECWGNLMECSNYFPPYTASIFVP